MSTSKITISQHSTAIWCNVTCPIPSGLSSSSIQIIVLVSTICPTICSRSFVAIPFGTWDSFKIFKRTSQWVSDDNRRDNMESCAGNLLSYSTTLLVKVFMNSMVSSSLTLFFFCGTLMEMSFPFLFLPSLSAKSIYTSCSTYLAHLWNLLVVISPIIKTLLVLRFGTGWKIINLTFETRTTTCKGMATNNERISWRVVDRGSQRRIIL